MAKVYDEEFYDDYHKNNDKVLKLIYQDNIFELYLESYLTKKKVVKYRVKLYKKIVRKMRISKTCITSKWQNCKMSNFQNILDNCFENSNLIISKLIKKRKMKNSLIKCSLVLVACVTIIIILV